MEKIGFDKAFDDLERSAASLLDKVDWATDEIKRLNNENMELRLKIDNLLYMLRTVTQGRELQ